MSDLGSVVVGGLVGGLAATLAGWVKRSWDKADKAVERQASRRDAHRIELRTAYAEFIAAYSKFLDDATLMIKTMQVVHSQRHDAAIDAINRGGEGEEADAAYASGGSPELIKKVRLLMDETTSASTTSNIKAASVRLLEDNPELRQQVLGIVGANIAFPESTDDYDRFEHDVNEQRPKLESLAEVLAGAFAPEKWHGRKELTAGDPSK